eukprot:NODE_448_length_7291_cov_0.696329.p5 type:complete len:141 gc:universal NODE_448_length_7291_cov_0.696329:2275-2697(+)
MVVINLNGRLGLPPKKAIRKTRNGPVEVIELRFVANPFVSGKRYTNYYNATVWPGRFENIVSCLDVGSAVVVTGVLYCSEYTDKNGQAKEAKNINILNMEFPVVDSQDILEKRKEAKKAKLEHMDDNSALPIEDDSINEN